LSLFVQRGCLGVARYAGVLVRKAPQYDIGYVVDRSVGVYTAANGGLTKL
jgi:hypothetical protein